MCPPKNILKKKRSPTKYKITLYPELCVSSFFDFNRLYAGNLLRWIILYVLRAGAIPANREPDILLQLHL